MVVSGVMGVEVNTTRVWSRAEELGLSRVVFVNMLDRERADFFRTLGYLREQLSEPLRRDPAADRQRARAARRRRPAPQLRLPRPGGRPRGRRRSPIPDEHGRARAEYREKLLDAVVETDEALMERYLGGEELDPAAVAAALKTRGHARRALPGRLRGRDAATSARTRCSTCSSRASPRRRASRPPIETRRRHGCVRLQDGRRPLRRPDLLLPGLRRQRSAPTRRSSTCATRRRSASASLMILQGKEHEKATAFGAGDIGVVAKLKDVQTGDLLADSERELEPPAARLHRAGDELRRHPEDEGRRGQGRPGAPAAARGGPDAAAAARPADGRAAALGHEPGARRGRRRPAEEPLRRRGRAAPAARPLRRDDQGRGARPGPLQEADGRPRPVRRLRDRDRAARGPRRLRVRRPDRRRRDPAGLPAGGRQGRAGDDGARRARRRAGAGGARAARRRLLPHRRLLRDGLQGRGLDGVQVRLREGAADPARADHGARGHRPRRGRRARSTATSTRAAAASRAWTPRAA